MHTYDLIDHTVNLDAIISLVLMMYAQESDQYELHPMDKKRFMSGK